MSRTQVRDYLMSPFQEAMAEAVLDELDRRSMSRKDLTKAANLSVSTVNSILIGKNTGYLFTWQAIFDVLGLHVKLELGAL